MTSRSNRVGAGKNPMTQRDDVWAGQGESYHRARPSPPSVIVDILTQLTRTPRPDLVADLGSGTGLSTMLWAGHAEQVIGVEPSDEMRAQAVRRLATSPHVGRIDFRPATAEDTGLPTGGVDIVTCSQSFHWMEPVATLAEVARVLRPGGLFAAYDYDWPPIIDADLDRVYRDVEQRFEALPAARRAQAGSPPRWPKSEHLDRVRASGLFRAARDIGVHHREEGDAARYLEFVRSGEFGLQCRRGVVSAAEVQFEQLEDAAHRYIGARPVSWYFSYRVVMAVR